MQAITGNKDLPGAAALINVVANIRKGTSRVYACEAKYFFVLKFGTRKR
jgi:hypothetical protein